WFDGLERDWTVDELAEMAHVDAPIYVHNHVRHWTADLVELYRRRGFLLFTFVRPVGDQLCSLYYWVRRHCPEAMQMDLDTFLRRQLRGETIADFDFRDWMVPEYWDRLGFACVFSKESFMRFLSSEVRIDWEPESKWAQPCNVTENPGYGLCCRRGVVSPMTQRLIASSRFQKRYETIAQRESVV
ncbi:MAG TPA: hypothetical protein VMM76_09145, partial [Pirellulaceae bacterium]|nr:hypothetical protein [Pirellulaceae bacterium]